MITIAKASAGSGKTYTLAKTYISLLLTSKEPQPYRHILAVTFTNKATDEMKSRIVKELDILAHYPEHSDYFRDFVPSICPDAATLGKRCSLLLSGILNDYSAFSVCTIDKFFQSVLRSFARELGQFDSYQIEIDKKSIVNESVDRLLDSLKPSDKDLVGWLRESMMNQISSKGYFRLEETLYNAALDLQSQEFKAYLAKNGISDLSKTYSKTRMRALRKACDDLVASYTSAVSGAAQKVLSIFSSAGIEASQAKRGVFSGLGSYASADSSALIEGPAATLAAGLADKEKLFSKANAVLSQRLSSAYETAAAALLSLFGSDFSRAYRTAFQIRESIYGLGISKELSEAFTSLLKEKNLLCLDDSSALLTRIIDGSDVPFVYEKTGSRYHHFLLDEFQDTSLVQWENFRPLLGESDDNGRDNLIVGDVKQSIYRWRQSDWDLLNSQVVKDFPHSREYLGADGKPALGTNFRTEENIVEFNNCFFEFLRDKMAATFPGEGGEMIRGIYSDVRQAAHKKGGYGQVKICFYEKPKDKNAAPAQSVPVIDRTVEEVVFLHGEKGVKYADIAIVSRNNAPGEKIASALMERGIPVISDDSLTVGNSIVVRRLVSILSSVENPENQVAGYLARETVGITPSGETSLVNISESIISGMRQKDEALVESHSLYIQAFMDWMQGWVERNGNHLADFLRAWKDASEGLKIASPATSDAVRIITIHKSKGLEFPYVIIPGIEDISFFRHGSQWAEPALAKNVTPADAAPANATPANATPTDAAPADAAPADEAADAPKPALPKELSSEDEAVKAFEEAVSGQIFKPTISSKSAETYFDKVYEHERLYQCIDALNLMYVALTRPILGLCIICGGTSSSDAISSASDALLKFVDSNSSELKIEKGKKEGWGPEYTIGEFCSKADVAFRKKEKKHERKFEEMTLQSTYPSFPMDSTRLRMDKDAADFFSEDGAVGIEASPRLRGIVLHDILSSIETGEDLPEAIDKAVMEGLLTSSQAAEASSLLSSRIAKAREERGWFSGGSSCRVLNERAVAPASGEECRPDRVEISPDGTSAVIIDYKFGHRSGLYRTQVLEYIRAYRQMGFASVKGYLWYVGGNQVEEVFETE